MLGAPSGIGALALDGAVGRRGPVCAFARGAGHLEKTELTKPIAGDARSAGDVGAAGVGCAELAKLKRVETGANYRFR